jgi:hypothetical protein
MLNKQIGFSLFCLLILLCSKGNKDIVGTTTETTTGCAIEGLIVYNDSSSVKGADVVLHDQRLVKIISLAKRTTLIRSGKTKTNVNGFFRIDSVDTGGYLVEVNDHDTLGALLKAQIKGKDTLVQANGVLKRTGCIMGRVDTSKIKGTNGFSIYLPEINIKVSIDSAGNFTIKNIPNWNYVIRVSVKDSIINLPSDSIKVPVIPGDTTKILQLGAKTGTVIINSKIIENPHD